MTGFCTARAWAGSGYGVARRLLTWAGRLGTIRPQMGEIRVPGGCLIVPPGDDGTAS